MGLFSRKPEVSSKESVNKTAVIRNLTDDEGESLFEDLFRMLESIGNMSSRSLNPQKAREDFQETVVRVMNDVRTEWQAIDRSRLNPEDANFMYSVLATGLPALLVECRSLSRNGLTFALESPLKVNDSDLQGATINEGLHVYLTRLISIHDTQWRVDYTNRVPKATLAVPAAAKSDYDLRDELEGLHELWVQASGRSLASADRFYVDEVAARYFPDSWAMFERFDSDDPALVGEARRIFLEQVAFMAKHLETIIRKTHNEDLERMRSQSSFLQGLAT